MKISDISLRNIRCFEKFDLSFTSDKINDVLQVCALVGANGAGKTSILQSIVSTFSLIDNNYKGNIFDNSVITTGNDEATVDIKLQFSKNEINDLKSQKINYSTINSVASYYSEEQDFDFLGNKSHADVIFPSNLGINTNELYTVKDRQEFEAIMRFMDDSSSENKSLDIFNTNIKKILELYKEYDSFLDYLRMPNKCLLIYIDAFRHLSTSNSLAPNFSVELSNAKECALKNSIVYDKNLKCDKISLRNFNLQQWIINLDYANIKNPNNVHDKSVLDFLIKTCNTFFDNFEYQGIDSRGKILFKEISNPHNILDLSMLSDGFKSVFSIVGEIIERLSIAYPTDVDKNIDFNEGEAVILIDEIDCHMHPKWQRNFVPNLKKLFPNCQFIITTHSPYILDSLQPYEVIKIGDNNYV